MNKDFFFNLGAGFIFVLLVCGSIILADYVFFEGQLLRKAQTTNQSLTSQLDQEKKENDLLLSEVKGREVEMQALMQSNQQMQETLQGLMDENKMLKDALNTPEHAFMAHLEDAIHQKYPSIDVVDGKFIFKDDIFFASASTVLSKDGKEDLRRIAKIIQELEGKISVDANWAIKVMGHADAQTLKYKKPFSSNWILASSRAATIVQYLISQGVSPSRLYVAGYAAPRVQKGKIEKDVLTQSRRAVISFDRRVGDA
jgi:chemotaxis protein MotB